MHSFTFNGVNSRTYGLMVSGSGAFNAPERDVSVISIPGRNGDLVVDNGRYKNITVEYPGFIAENFRVNARGARSWLTSPLGYKRLEDDYNPDEYRLARFKEGLEFEMLGENEAGTTTIKFDCLPQRFLKSGEEELPFDNEIETLSGSVVTFQNDGRKIISSLEAEINPVQEGSGDPYPAGGGNNLFPKPNQNRTFTYEGVSIARKIDGSFVISGSSEINDLYMYVSLPSDQVVSSGMYFSFGTNDVKSWFGNENLFKVYLLNTYPTDGRAPTSSEILAEYVPNRNNEPVLIQNSGTAKSIGIFAGLVTFPYGDTEEQTGQVTLTCWPTLASTKEGAKFKNIRPITGWTGAKVTRTGKNLLDVRKSTAFNNKVTLTFNADGSMTCKNDNSYAVVPTSSMIISVPNGIYTVSSSSATTSATGIAFYASDDGVNYSWYADGLSPTVLSKTITINKPYVQFRWQVGGNTTETLPPIQLELGSTATAYEPYQSDTYSITFPSAAGTVYGGTLDLTNGVLTVNMAVVDLGSFDWNKVEQSGYKFFYAGLPNGSRQDNSKCVCSLYKSAESALEFQDNDKICRQYGSTTWGFSRVAIKDSSYNDSTSAEVKTAMSGVQFVYKLATPLTYQLTPQEIRTLLGINNIWTDTGDTTIVVSSKNILENPTSFDALPLIKIEGSGEGVLTINNQVVTISNIDEYVILDSDLKIAYKGSESKTNTMVGEFPILSPGNNIISYSGGITSVKITPRWWIL